MLFYIGSTIFSFIITCCFLLIFILSMKSKKPNKRVKIIISIILTVIAVAFCVITLKSVLIPEVTITMEQGVNERSFEWNGHQYVEESSSYSSIPSPSKLVAYYIYNNNKFLGYLSADRIYEINNHDNELYMTELMSPTTKFKKVN
jgi:amino acid transporter